MEQYESVLKLLLEAVQMNLSSTEKKQGVPEIPVGISNRHVHLSQAGERIVWRRL